ncbi:MAG: Pr6Pr family membrane protein, partial [Bacteroidota bacterium]|nr:Pr6Pr family membrane protein [Bacteroidota bacterium]
SITMYITIVGLIYNIILRFTWQPQGLQLLVDESLHTLIPILSIIYWWVYVRTSPIAWKKIGSWLAYPFIYFLFVLLRGIPSGFYPYPFINVVDLGYSKVLINAIFIFMVFLLASIVFIAIGKWKQTGSEGTESINDLKNN